LNDSDTDLRKMTQVLEKQNDILQNMLTVMAKPENTFIKVLEKLVLIAGVLSILNAADVIRNWLLGG